MISSPKPWLTSYCLRWITFCTLGFPAGYWERLAGEIYASNYGFYILVSFKGILITASTYKYPLRHLVIGSLIAGISVWGYWFDPRAILAVKGFAFYAPIPLGIAWVEWARRGRMLEPKQQNTASGDI